MLNPLTWRTAAGFCRSRIPLLSVHFYSLLPSTERRLSSFVNKLSTRTMATDSKSAEDWEGIWKNGLEKGQRWDASDSGEEP